MANYFAKIRGPKIAGQLACTTNSIIFRCLIVLPAIQKFSPFSPPQLPQDVVFYAPTIGIKVEGKKEDFNKKKLHEK